MKYTEKLSDMAAMSMTKFFRFFADAFFAKRYGHRAVVLETIAGVPGMVAGMLLHMRSLRRMERGNGTMIQELLDEAVNERKHLMFFIEIAQPNWFERLLIVLAQGVFFTFYIFMYIFFPRTSHKMIAYFEEEAVISYTNYLEMILNQQIENVPAPQIAIDYYNLDQYARLSDLVRCVRDDEARHAEANHRFANTLSKQNKYIDILMRKQYYIFVYGEQMKLHEVYEKKCNENTVAGAVASVAQPMGAVIKRKPKKKKKKKD